MLERIELRFTVRLRRSLFITGHLYRYEGFFQASTFKLILHLPAEIGAGARINTDIPYTFQVLLHISFLIGDGSTSRESACRHCRNMFQESWVIVTAPVKIYAAVAHHER
ncbi:hypothetical protein EDP2_3839 [Enterobacter cloacae S611]|uniref:Uncharacterized protein n=1 Tax=Enterobacter cloacae S611 TaxID=1399146 RepID=A0ABN0QAF0_ENTCL|nr:hypothetical protein EDP2_3839 [Enterobacter cloacae S611]